MPKFDATQPPDTQKAGLGAKRIREDLKGVFNADFEGKMYELIDAALECVKGWPRIYVAASSSPPTPPTNADEGRIWFVTDLKEVRAHDGSAWVRLSAGPAEVRIPVIHGPGLVFTNDAYADLYAGVSVNAAGGHTAINWGFGQGFSFNKAQAPVGVTIKLAAVTRGTGGSVYLRLYDVGAGAPVSGSEITCANDGTEYVSGDLAAQIAGGDRKLRLQARVTTGGTGHVAFAELRILRT